MFTSTNFLQPAAILGFAGLATLIHYNDEKRVTLKGTFFPNLVIVE